MKKPLLLIFTLCFLNNLLSQGRLVINNNGFIVLSNSVTLVIDNSATNAITTIGGGNIISENEMNQVKWNIGNNTGVYTIPFTKTSGTATQIPLTFSITTAGTGMGGGTILFSTYGGPTWDNLTYMPSGVTNMSGYLMNNSAGVIDRFWIIDAQNYTIKPASEIQFTYIDAEHQAAGNSINESSLFAQRFNNTIGSWGDWLGTYMTANTMVNTVLSGTVSAADLKRSWTLVNQSTPLPVQLTSFSVSCKDNGSHLFEFTTLTETENELFTIYRSNDSKNWSKVTTLHGSGKSLKPNNYSFLDDKLYSDAYFVLNATDNKGHTYNSAVVFNKCAETEYTRELKIFPNPGSGQFNISFNSFEKGEIEIAISDIIGRILEKRIVNIEETIQFENFNLQNQVSGIYFASIKTSGKTITQKLIIEK